MNNIISYSDRETAKYFTDFAGNLKREQIGECMWHYVPDFMPPEMCDLIVSEVRKNNPNFQKGTGLYIPEGGDKNYRDSDVHFISDMDNEIYRGMRDFITAKTIDFNSRIFNLNLTHLMHIQYTQYNENYQHFTWHSDGPFSVHMDPSINMTDDLVFRKLTTVVCLTDYTEYEGGEFMLFDGMALPEHSICQFKMSKGEAIMFPAFMLHRVMPVTKGLRISLVNWFCGPRWS